MRRQHAQAGKQKARIGDTVYSDTVLFNDQNEECGFEFTVTSVVGTDVFGTFDDKHGFLQRLKKTAGHVYTCKKATYIGASG